jgi:SAM-dependent methyltransferase
MAVPASAAPRATPTSPSGCTACTPVGEAMTGSAISCPSTDVASCRVAGRSATCGGVNRSSLNAATLSRSVMPCSAPATSDRYTDLGRRRRARRRASATVSNHSRVLAIGTPSPGRPPEGPILALSAAIIHLIGFTNMSADSSLPEAHPDRVRWNARYADGFRPSFRPHPLAMRALAMDLPDGPVADLACGASGSALLAAARGRRVSAFDISELALGMLGDEARRRSLEHLITLIHADLAAWPAPPRSYALVLCTGFWMKDLFGAAAGAVQAGGLLGWEAFTAEAGRVRSDLSPDWCLASGQPASLLPADFTVLDQHDLPERGRRRMLARRQ